MARISKFLLALIFSLITLYSVAAALEPGEDAPAFKLKSHEGKDISLGDFKGKIVILEWFNPGCPFVKNHYATGNLPSLQEEYQKKGVVWLTVTSTNPAHKDFLTPEKAARSFTEMKFASTALLLDPDGVVGKAYGAKTTPHMFIIGKEGKLAYQGAIDDQPDPNADPAQGRSYLRTALDEILGGKPVSMPQTKPYGCSVKYAG